MRREKQEAFLSMLSPQATMGRLHSLSGTLMRTQADPTVLICRVRLTPTTVNIKKKKSVRTRFSGSAVTLVILGHSSSFSHDVLRLFMTHSRLRITHAVMNPSHAPLSLWFSFILHSHNISHCSHTPFLIWFLLLIESAWTMFEYVWLQ